MIHPPELVKIEKAVLRENNIKDRLELAEVLFRELSARRGLGILTVHSKKVVRVGLAYTEDDAIINLYTEVESDNEQGLYGFGYAWNITYDLNSEWGYLWQPSNKVKLR